MYINHCQKIMYQGDYLISWQWHLTCCGDISNTMFLLNPFFAIESWNCSPWSFCSPKMSKKFDSSPVKMRLEEHSLPEAKPSRGSVRFSLKAGMCETAPFSISYVIVWCFLPTYSQAANDDGKLWNPPKSVDPSMCPGQHSKLLKMGKATLNCCKVQKFSTKKKVHNLPDFIFCCVS